MTNDKLMRDYHDKATRGLPLAADERDALEAWYAEQDEEEAALLNRTVTTGPTTLQAQVDAGLAELTRTTQRIQSLAAENETLRQEIAGLYQRLSQTQTAQKA